MVLRLWVLAGLIPPIPLGAWVVGARVRRCQLLLEHLCNIVVVLHDLNQFSNVFFERVGGWGALDFSGYSNGEPQNEESLNVSFADVIACFSSERSELSNVLVHVISF